MFTTDLSLPKKSIKVTKMFLEVLDEQLVSIDVQIESIFISWCVFKISRSIISALRLGAIWGAL